MDIPSHKLPKRALRKDFAIASHYVEVDPSVTPAEAMDPSFWQHFAAKFRVRDEVTVSPTDLSYHLVAQVIAIDPAGHWVVMRSLSFVQGLSVVIGAKDDGGYRIDHDPVQGWRILNGRDLIEKDLPDEQSARDALASLRGKKKAA